MQLNKETINQIYELYKQGFTKAQISKQLKINVGTVRSRLKKDFGVTKKETNKKIDDSKFIEMWNQGKTDKEIADFFGVKEITIRSYRTKGEKAGKYKLIRNFSQEKHTLSYEQEQFILGSLLGDLNLSNPKSHRCINSRLALVQGEAQKELFMKKVEILGEFMGKYRLCIPKPDSRTGKIYKSYRGNSKSHKIFTDIYNILYINSKKTVTQQFLNKITSPIALAFWFMDDGTYNGTLATNSFSEQEVDLLISWLYNKWNIISTKERNLNQFIIRLSMKTRETFENLIRPYIIPSMEYKLKYK